MDKNNFKQKNVYVSEEEKTLNWEEIPSSFKKKYKHTGYFNVRNKNFSFNKKDKCYKSNQMFTQRI